MLHLQKHVLLLLAAAASPTALFFRGRGIKVITDNIPKSLNSCYAFSKDAQTWAWFKAFDDDSGQESRGVHVTALTCLNNDKSGRDGNGVYEVPAGSLKDLGKISTFAPAFKSYKTRSGKRINGMPYPAASNKNCAQWVNRLNKFYHETGVIAEVAEAMKRGNYNKKATRDSTGKFIEALCRIQRDGIQGRSGLPNSDGEIETRQGESSQVNEKLFNREPEVDQEAENPTTDAPDEEEEEGE
ncbi:hypothetical protein FOZ61_004689 [Perkinsus olseni]|uniref:Uncharacterized protein n=1 Tax=Perkinsus olseni TaxID=32597 RepID=A0A7J6LK21_PEROL|nr:hypothetical protein FOZ61_004689 [Perkinsus olseni]